jgi:hypothetical protein
MEACPGLDLADEDTFERRIAFVESQVEYVFKKRRANTMQWELSMWSRQVQHLSIEKHGTNFVKAALPTGTSHFNKPRKTGTFKRKEYHPTTGVDAVCNHHNNRGQQLQ